MNTWAVPVVITTVASLAQAPVVGSAPSFPVAVGSAVNLTHARGNQAETAAAVNPTNPSNVVVVSNTESAALFEAYTVDGGTTWKSRRIADGDELGLACCDPSIGFDEFGNLFLAFLALHGDAIVAGISTDGGASFSLLAEVRSGPVDQPTVTTGAGTVWFTWVHSIEPTTVEARGASVAGLGQVGELEAGQAVPHSRGSNFGDIAVGPDGQVLVAFENRAGSEGPSDIWVALDPDGLGPLGFGDPAVATITNVGGTEHIPAQDSRTIDAEPGLVYDRSGGGLNGRVYLVYTDEDPPESDDTDVFIRYSDDDGVIWSPPIKVSDDPGTNGQFLQRIALDQSTGLLAVTWHDARDDLGDGGPGDTDGFPNDDVSFYATISIPGEVAFRPSVRLAGTTNAAAAQSPWDLGDYTGLSFAGGVFFPAWGDNSNSTRDNPDGRLSHLDVYTAKAVVPTIG